MSDERFHDEIRDALLADDPGAVPTRLRARMAMIPDEAPGRQAPNTWRQRLARNAVPIGVLAAALVIVVVFGSIALRAQQVATVIPSVPSLVPSVGPSSLTSIAPSVVPSGTPSPSASVEPSAPPSSSASAAPLSSGPIAIDAGRVTGLQQGTFALSGNRAFWRSASDTVSYPLLGWSDLSNSSNGGYVVMLENGHDIADHAITDAGFVWIETWYRDKPIDCSGMTGCGVHQGQAISWALNLTTLDRKTTRLDSGVVSRIDVEGEGASATPPAMAAHGNRVAYAVPRATRGITGQPEASEIIVRSLPDGAVLRTVNTAGYVAQLGLSGQTLAFREAKDDGVHTGVDPANATLKLFTSDTQGVPVVLGEHVQQLSVGDGGTGSVRIAWTTSQPDDAMLHATTPDQSQRWDVNPPSSAMTIGWTPVIVGDGYVWLAQQQDAQGAWSTVVLAWRPGWPSARTIPGLGSPDWIGSSDGKLLFGGSDVPVLRNVAPVGAISAADVFGS